MSQVVELMTEILLELRAIRVLLEPKEVRVTLDGEAIERVAAASSAAELRRMFPR